MTIIVEFSPMDAVWPSEIEPTCAGYSVGKWIDEDGDDRYDVLEVETRGPFKGPRAYDAGGSRLHFHNQTTFGERFLSPQRGRLAYANAQRSASAGPAIFQTVTEIATIARILTVQADVAD